MTLFNLSLQTGILFNTVPAGVFKDPQASKSLWLTSNALMSSVVEISNIDITKHKHGKRSVSMYIYANVSNLIKNPKPRTSLVPNKDAKL